MPAKYRVKDYRAGGTYYIYSRAKTGRNIFEDEVDHNYWLKLWERYIGGKVAQENNRYKPDRPYRLRQKQEMVLKDQIKILTYCQMPKSIYLLIWQRDADGITKLMRRVITNYTMYLNRRHGKRGKVFAGVYRGVLITDEQKMVALSRWIHRVASGKIVRRFGPVETVSGLGHEEYLYSSYRSFLADEQNSWLDTKPVKQGFEKMAGGKWKTYSEYVDDNKVADEQIAQIVERPV
jgi:hypothetical protein